MRKLTYALGVAGIAMLALADRPVHCTGGSRGTQLSVSSSPLLLLLTLARRM